MADHEENLMACEEKQEEKVASILQVKWLQIFSKRMVISFPMLCSGAKPQALCFSVALPRDAFVLKYFDDTS